MYVIILNYEKIVPKKVLRYTFYVWLTHELKHGVFSQSRHGVFLLRRELERVRRMTYVHTDALKAHIISAQGEALGNENP